MRRYARPQLDEPTLVTAIDGDELTPSRQDLERVFAIKYGDVETCGWSPRMRHRVGYFNPDDRYETLVDRLVGEQTVWLDAGCGRFLFPSNAPLAKQLSERCAHLVGVDPDETLEENPYVHERARVLIDDYETDRQFDLVTLRMVAEHVAAPDVTVESLARLTRPGGRVVIFTIYRWSPVPLLTDIVPFGLHHPVKNFLWKTESKDTFPVANKMNTRGALRRVFERHGFAESSFRYVDDCRTFANSKFLQWLELSTWRLLRTVGLHYPEVCLLAVYTRQ
jgi:SAM-dependent methyltransferase